jgi:hypothetical protein
MLSLSKHVCKAFTLALRQAQDDTPFEYGQKKATGFKPVAII